MLFSMEYNQIIQILGFILYCSNYFGYPNSSEFMAIESQWINYYSQSFNDEFEIFKLRNTVKFLNIRTPENLL